MPPKKVEKKKRLALSTLSDIEICHRKVTLIFRTESEGASCMAECTERSPNPLLVSCHVPPHPTPLPRSPLQPPASQILSSVLPLCLPPPGGRKGGNIFQGMYSYTSLPPDPPHPLHSPRHQRYIPFFLSLFLSVPLPHFVPRGVLRSRRGRHTSAGKEIK